MANRQNPQPLPPRSHGWERVTLGYKFRQALLKFWTLPALVIVVIFAARADPIIAVAPISVGGLLLIFAMVQLLPEMDGHEYSMQFLGLPTFAINTCLIALAIWLETGASGLGLALVWLGLQPIAFGFQHYQKMPPIRRTPDYLARILSSAGMIAITLALNILLLQ